MVTYVEEISEKLFSFCPIDMELLGCGELAPTIDWKASLLLLPFPPGDVSLFARCEVIVEKVFFSDSTSDPPRAEFR